MKMFVHAEKKNAVDNLNDGDLSLFVRLGSDYTTNYYEYEVPLRFTPWFTPSDDPYSIWPEDNNVDIDIQHMTVIKTNRNIKIRSGEGGYSPALLYTEMKDGKKYTVLGNPNLGKVKVIMIGIRNPRKQSLDDGNDMMPKSAIIWVNELRLSDYINKIYTDKIRNHNLDFSSNEYRDSIVIYFIRHHFTACRTFITCIVVFLN